MPQGRSYPATQRNRQQPKSTGFQMPQQQRKRSQFNHASGFQNALTTAATLAPINPYLAIPGAIAGYYFGGKSGPFEPSAQDYQPQRDAFQQYQRGANRDLQQGVNAIGQQSSQRAASQGLYGSPLGQSIIQNNQNYALNTGLENINQNRYQFEQGLAQQQFTDQRAYDQQMQSQNIGTLQNLAFNALPIYNQYFRGNPQEEQIKSGLQKGLGQVGQIAAGITQGGQASGNPNALPPTPDSHSAQRALTDPAGLGATSSARHANVANAFTNPQQGAQQGGGTQSPQNGGSTPSELTTPTPNDANPYNPDPNESQASGGTEGTDSPPVGNISDPSIPINAPEGLAADAIEPGLGQEIAEFFGADLFDDDFQPRQTFEENLGQYGASVGQFPAPQQPQPQTQTPPQPQPAPVAEQPQVNPFTSSEPGSVYTEDFAMDTIKFGESGAVDGKYASKAIVDPTSGYNIGWGRSITGNGLDVQNELIPMLRASYPHDFQIQEKLRILGIRRDHKGNVTMTPSQFNQLFPFGINETQATMLLNNDIGRSQSELNGIFGEQQFYGLDPERQAVLIDMMHTLGNNRFRKFTEMIKAINAGNYYEAAYEMRNSLWYKQVGPRRANPLIAKMIGDVFNAQDKKQFNQRLGQSNFDSGVSSPPTSGIGFAAGLPLGAVSRAIIGATPDNDTSTGKLREMESDQRREASRKFRENKSDNFIRVADAIDNIYVKRMNEDQQFARGGVYRGAILNMKDSGEITEDDSNELIDYLETKYPGRMLPEKPLWKQIAGLRTTIPVATENQLVSAGQKYLGLDENQQKSYIQKLLKQNDINYNGKEIDPSQFPWCASFIASVLNEAGYEIPNGADKLRARKYIKYGTPSDGKIGDLMVFDGHVGIVAKIEDNGDIWIVGGNQGDRIELKKIQERMNYSNDPATNPNDFIGFVTPKKRAN